MPSADITSAEPASTTLVAAAFDQPDYRDAFVVRAADDLITVDDVASAYFLRQPRWLSAVSMNLLSRQQLTDAVDAADGASYSVGSSVGSWSVQQRSNDEIVFGDDMGFMRYCFSLWRRSDGTVEASTAVAYRWPRASRCYFALVKPMHRRFVPMSLRSITETPAAPDVAVEVAR